MKFSRFLRFYCLAVVALAACGGVSTESDPSSEDGVVSTVSQPLMNTTWSGNTSMGGVDAAVASRSANALDTFWVNTYGRVFYRGYYAGTWYAATDMGMPAGMPSSFKFSHVAAVANAGRLDIFAMGSNGLIYHKYSTQTGFTAWINDIPVLVGESHITVSSWGGGRLDVFWWKNSSAIGHAWFVNNQFAGEEAGSSTSPWLLAPTGSAAGYRISAKSWGSNRIDLVYASTRNSAGRFTEIQHHWYHSYNGWGTVAA